MGGIMAPMTRPAVIGNTSAGIKVRPIVIAAIVYINHLTPMPMEAAEIKAWPHMDARTPVETADKSVMTGVMPVNGRIVRPPPVAIDHACIVDGHIDDALDCRLDNDDFFFALNTHVLKL